MARAHTAAARARVQEADDAWAEHLRKVDERIAQLNEAVREASGVDVPSYYLPSAGGMSLYPGHPKNTDDD